MVGAEKDVKEEDETCAAFAPLVLRGVDLDDGADGGELAAAGGVAERLGYFSSDACPALVPGLADPA